MAKRTTIEWTDSTWNPWYGCTKISAGCKNCYMYRDRIRFDDPSIVRRASSTFDAPLRWLDPRLVFVCSWSDFFIEKADEWRKDAWDIMRRTVHTYQLLTKRPENILDRLPPDWGDGWENVWLGVSVETPDYTWRLDELAKVPAQVRFVSYEPALAPVDFTPWLAAGVVHWVISGGESGFRYRPADPDWFRSVRDQCAKANVPYFHKQNGGDCKINGSWGGRMLDSQTYEGMPWNISN